MNAFIFDMDGTILNSMDFWFNIGDEILAMNGIEEKLPPKAFEKITLYQGLELIRNTFNLSKSVDDMDKEVFEYVYSKYLNELELKKGTFELFEYIKNNGGKIAIATATDRKYVDGFLIKYKEILDYIDFVETVRVGGPTKNDVDFFTDILKNFPEEPKKVYMFEDAPHAMRTAKKAGFTVVGIIEDTHPELVEEAIRDSDYHYDNLIQLDRSILEF